MEPDSWPLGEVGYWAREKYELLAKYVEISSGVRGKFTPESEATYLDPYSSFGRARCRDTGEILDGSPLVAARAAAGAGVPFSRVLIGDESRPRVTICERRLAAAGVRTEAFYGSVESTVGAMCRSLHPYGLHFALLDPYDLDLPFAAIKRLAQLRRIDLMIHLSTGTLQRNLHNLSRSENETLDAFAPEWRDVVPSDAQGADKRAAIVGHWFQLLKGIGLPGSPEMHAVRNSKNSRMYWLIFASKAEIAKKFWRYAQAYLPQAELRLE